MKKKLSSLPINMTILKIFISIVLISTAASTLLFLISFLGMVVIASNGGDIFPNNPRGILTKISENFSITADDAGNPVSYALADETILPEDNWCILLNENGDIIWSLHKPSDIPDHYSLNDVARLTRWFLNDYPVYVRAEDYGLFILGIPKNMVGKYSIEYTMEWFDTLFVRILSVFIMIFFLSMLLCSLFGSFLYKKIRLLTEGLVKLRREEAVSLPAKGIFKEPFFNITKTSQTLARKNAQLSARDRARSNWISGISHDIRTPLSMVVGYGGQLAEDPSLSEENKNYASIITAQGLKIKKLIEDLNLISSLEYEMQPVNRQPLQIAVLLRSVVSEMLNSFMLSEPDSQTDSSLQVLTSEIPTTDSDLWVPDAETLCSPQSPSSEMQMTGSTLWMSDARTLSFQQSSSSREAQPKFEISLSLNCGQATVLGDESLLDRAFYNLLQNSITHNEKGCQITVSASLETDCVLIVIADNGQGVPDKVLENLDTLPGTAHGFGLPMACKIIRAHGGTFHAENRGGFTVSIRLPLLIP